MRQYAVLGASTLVAAHFLFFPGNYVSFSYFPHLVSELSIAIFLLGFVVISGSNKFKSSSDSILLSVPLLNVFARSRNLEEPTA